MRVFLLRAPSSTDVPVLLLNHSSVSRKPLAVREHCALLICLLLQKVTGEAGYVAFKTCTPLFHQLLQEINNDRTSDLRILDVGAGTGLVGNVLRDHGYRNIDALDISQKMLDEAKKLNIYKNMFCVALGEKPIPGIENDQYDAAI